MGDKLYSPECFVENDREKISEIIVENPLGALITIHDSTPYASHLPLIYEHGVEGKGRLFGHFARANSQWGHLQGNAEVLVIFQGPHAYVSPSWYVSPGVPTWNYVVVHVRGVPRVIKSEAETESILKRLTGFYEQSMPSPWKPAGQGEFQKHLLSMIVCFEVEITDIEAKFKLSQNRSVEEQCRIARELSCSGVQRESNVGRLMRRDESN